MLIHYIYNNVKDFNVLGLSKFFNAKNVYLIDMYAEKMYELHSVNLEINLNYSVPFIINKKTHLIDTEKTLNNIKKLINLCPDKDNDLLIITGGNILADFIKHSTFNIDCINFMPITDEEYKNHKDKIIDTLSELFGNRLIVLGYERLDEYRKTGFRKLPRGMVLYGKYVEINLLLTRLQ